MAFAGIITVRTFRWSVWAFHSSFTVLWEWTECRCQPWTDDEHLQVVGFSFSNPAVCCPASSLLFASHFCSLGFFLLVNWIHVCAVLYPSVFCLCLSSPCLTLQNLHQLKQIHTLRQMNEQLLAENRALTRVVARLSQSAETPESEEL